MSILQPGNKVRLETMISTEPIPWNTSCEEFAVQVLVTAPAAIPTNQSEAEGVASGVDLVAVLDISGGMNVDGRLERMKEAMVSVMGQLCPDDRLCILSFNDEVQRLTELCPMSDVNWDNAAAKIQELAAPAGGGADVKAATDAAATVLAQRGEEEQSNRVGRVIFLSGGGDDEEDDATAGQKQSTNSTSPGEFSPDPATASPEVAPAGVFVLGADDGLTALSFGAGNTSGAYTCVKENVDKINDAPGLTSVDTATMGVQIDVHAQEGVAVSSIGSGGNRVSVGPDGPRSLTVYVQDLYAGEQRSFTVYLRVPEAKEELLAVTGWYSDPESGEDVQIDASQVFVLRPKELSQKVKVVWEKLASDVVPCSWPWLWALPCIAFLLLAATLYNWEDGSGIRRDLLLDHPGLPDMEEALQATMLGKMQQDAGIASIWDGAPVEDMSRAMNRYIYQALVPVLVPAQDVCPPSRLHVSLLEQTVEMLEAEKEELRVKTETLGEEKAECAPVPSKEKREALELAKTRIAELEQLLQNK